MTNDLVYWEEQLRAVIGTQSGENKEQSIDGNEVHNLHSWQDPSFLSGGRGVISLFDSFSSQTADNEKIGPMRRPLSPPPLDKCVDGIPNSTMFLENQLMVLIIAWKWCEGQSTRWQYPVLADREGPRGHAPSPNPVKISHKKDGRQRWPHRFHVSRPPLPGRWIRYWTSDRAESVGRYPSRPMIALQVPPSPISASTAV